MKKLIAALIVFIMVSALLAGSTFFVLRSTRLNTVVPVAAAASTASNTSTVRSVVAQAKVMPVRSVKLSFPSRGGIGDNIVTEVLVREGDVVEQGTPLIRLDTRDLQLRVEEAQASLAQAKADHDELVATSSTAPQAASSGDAARTAALTSATAQIQQAEAALKRAQLALDQATLRAPMAGTIVDVNVNAGEVPSMTEPAMVLADFSAWQIETSNLAEQDVVQIQEGDPVTITFNALPGLDLPGKVTQIKAIGQTSPNDVSAVYTVTITPDRQDERLRWNMTALVTITPSE